MVGAPGDSFFPEDYAGYIAKPWHAEPESVFEPTVSGDNIYDGVDWRDYPDGTRGFRRSNDTPTTIHRIGAETYLLTPKGGARRFGRHRVRSAPPDKELRRRDLAYKMLRDIFSRLDVRDGMLFTVSNNIVVKVLEKWRREKRNSPSRKDLAFIVIAAVEEAVQTLSSTIRKNDLYEAARASSLIGVALSIDEIRAGVWRMKSFMSDIVREVRINYWSRGSRRGYSIVKRALNIIDSVVHMLPVEESKKRLIAEVAKKLVETSYANGKDFYGKQPESIAAAAIYVAARLADYNIGQREVARLVNVNETNVRKSFRFLVEDQAILIVPKLVEVPESPPEECPPEVRALRLSPGNPTG